jgi:hypothetical protein
MFQRLSLLQASAFWLLLSLIAPLYFGLISLHYGLAEFRVQDDARLHVAWLQQYVDADLFPDDLIADYYQSIQAVGFKALYWAMAQLGIAPLLLAKLLPTGLAVITTVYLFYLTLQFLPYPACGFWTTLFLNQNIWFKDDLISATPRAFIYPLFVAFLYYLLRQSRWLTLVAIGLTGLFYPQMVLVELGILALRRPGWRFGLAALATAALAILPFRYAVTQEFGPLVSATQMQQMPEFGLQGRREYFGVDFFSFWLGGASGIRLPSFPPILWASLALPWLKHPAAKNLDLLVQTLLASVGLFFLAHLLFPQLYLPSRYSFYSLRVVMAIAAGIAVFSLIWTVWCLKPSGPLNPPRVGDFEINLLNSKSPTRGGFRGQIRGQIRGRKGPAALFLAVVIALPAVPSLFLPVQGWVTGQSPHLYRFLAQQPRDTLVASLSLEADNLPALTQRSVLVSRELVLAYHPAFYAVMQQRIADLLRAQYGSLAELQQVIRQYGVDVWVVDQQFADPNYLLQQDWLIHSSMQSVVLEQVERLKAGLTPALTQAIGSCTALSEHQLIVLKAICISRLPG